MPVGLQPAHACGLVEEVPAVGGLSFPETLRGRLDLVVADGGGEEQNEDAGRPKRRRAHGAECSTRHSGRGGGMREPLNFERFWIHAHLLTFDL